MSNDQVPILHLAVVDLGSGPPHFVSNSSKKFGSDAGAAAIAAADTSTRVTPYLAEVGTTTRIPEDVHVVLGGVSINLADDPELLGNLLNTQYGIDGWKGVLEFIRLIESRRDSLGSEVSSKQ